METKNLDAALFQRMLMFGAFNLNQNRTIVNDLNVFPIPDGDTGDNMYMTISSGCSAIKDGSFDSLSDIAGANAKGMLLGARGNSGVILSRIFAGIAKGFENVKVADAKTLGEAFSVGIDEAYSAVQKPAEGTILTVYKDAVNFANSNITEEHTLEMFFNDFLLELKRSLDRTPELLQVLKEAGVVDSGGAGIVYIAEGMNNALTDAINKESEVVIENTTPDLSIFSEESKENFGYCTEFLLELNKEKTDKNPFDIDDLTKYLHSNGESVVAFLEDNIVKVHVHTKNPGMIISYVQQFGSFLTMKVENMSVQHSEVAIKQKTKYKKKYGIVCVASGDGIVKTFKDLGTDVVIEGGQSMNPSAQSFIDAFKEINAETILVFPNNSNVILTAEQAANIYNESDIKIIPTKTIGEGYCAISMLDLSLDVDSIISESTEIISSVVTGQVSLATRSTTKDGVNIEENDYLGFTKEKIYCSEKDKELCVLNLCEALNIKRYDIALIIQGCDSTDEETLKIQKELESKYRRTEIIVIKGDQPVFDYIIVLE